MSAQTPYISETPPQKPPGERARHFALTLRQFTAKLSRAFCLFLFVCGGFVCVVGAFVSLAGRDFRLMVGFEFFFFWFM